MDSIHVLLEIWSTINEITKIDTFLVISIQNFHLFWVFEHIVSSAVINSNCFSKSTSQNLSRSTLKYIWFVPFRIRIIIIILCRIGTIFRCVRARILYLIRLNSSFILYFIFCPHLESTFSILIILSFFPSQILIQSYL